MKKKMTKELFIKHMNDIINLWEFEDSINSVVSKYNQKNMEISSIYFPSLIDNVVELLELNMNDSDEMISYWVFELDVGKTYRDGCVSDADGNVIPLKTLDDLWNYLIMEE